MSYLPPLTTRSADDVGHRHWLELLAQRHRFGPILHLPDDLLMKIASESAEDPDDLLTESSLFQRAPRFPMHNPRLLVPLMLVCRRWYSVISSHSALWARVDGKHGKVRVALLERSKVALLSVIWSFDSMCDAADANIRQLAPVLAQVGRIRHLQLGIGGETYASHVQAQLPPVLSALETLVIHLTQTWKPEAERYLELCCAEKLQVLELRRVFFRDITTCAFPHLRVLWLSLSVNVEPTLADLLLFLSGSSLLQELTLQRLGQPIHTYVEELDCVVRLAFLERFTCITWADESPLLHLAKHMSFAPGCALKFEGDGSSWHLGLPPNRSTSLLPWESQQIKPHNIHILEYEKEVHIIFDCNELSPLDRLKRSFHRYRAAYRSQQGWEEECKLRCEAVAAIQQASCDISHLQQLTCEMWLNGSTWKLMFSSCTVLEHVTLRLDTVPGFTALFGHPLASSTSRPSLPALKVIEILEGGLSKQRTETWIGKLAMLAGLLEIRAAWGYSLDRFVIKRNTHWRLGTDHEDTPSRGWDGEADSLEAIRQCVPIVEVC